MVSHRYLKVGWNALRLRLSVRKKRSIFWPIALQETSEKGKDTLKQSELTLWSRHSWGSNITFACTGHRLSLSVRPLPNCICHRQSSILHLRIPKTPSILFTKNPASSGLLCTCDCTDTVLTPLPLSLATSPGYGQNSRRVLAIESWWSREGFCTPSITSVCIQKQNPFSYIPSHTSCHIDRGLNSSHSLQIQIYLCLKKINCSPYHKSTDSSLSKKYIIIYT